MLGKTAIVIATTILMTVPTVGQTIEGLEDSIQSNPNPPITALVRCYLDGQVLFGQNGAAAGARMLEFQLLADGMATINGMPVKPVDVQLNGRSSAAMFAVGDIVIDPKAQAQAQYLSDEDKRALQAMVAFGALTLTGGRPRFITVHFSDHSVSAGTMQADGQMGDMTSDRCPIY